jgi:PAS domain S-box-containing protein
MNSLWKSPGWAWLPLFPALLFAAWSFWLVHHFRLEHPPVDLWERSLLPLALAGFVLSLLLCLVLHYNQRDLHELRRTEAALRASEERFRAFMENSPAVAFIKDAQGRYVYGNRAWAERLGKAPEEILGKTDAELWPDQTARLFRDSDRRVLTGGDVLQAIESAPLPSGETRWWKVFKFPMRDPRGQALVGGVVVDITEQKRAEEALRDSEQRYRLLAENSSDVISRHDLAGSLLYISPTSQALFGRPPKDLLGRSAFEFVHPDDIERVGQAYRRLLGGAETVTIACRALAPDGSYRWVESAARRLHAPQAGSPDELLVATRDISDRVCLEEKLRQAEKLEAVGQLAGGVAHDFNNMLAVILGCSDLALRALPPGSETHELLRQIHDAGGRAAHLTRQLLFFARKHQVRPTVFDLNAVVAPLERILRRLINEDITLVTRLAEVPCPVCADRGQLELALVNLAVNARDAMPGGGTLEITTAALTRDDDRRGGRAPGRYVRLSVRDTGHGMDEETRARIFEPFFTTKEVGKGTGLGLATVYGVVAQSGGFIDVESQVGRGSAFHVYVPAAEAVPAERAPDPAPMAWPRGDETILVVEDETEVRSLARRVLEVSGYTVLEAGNGREALVLARRHGMPVPLLLTDVVMPEMGGPELARELLRDWPRLKVLFMSGYADGAPGQHVRTPATAPLLHKPFTPGELAAAVRALLDRASPVAPAV